MITVYPADPIYAGCRGISLFHTRYFFLPGCCGCLHFSAVVWHDRRVSVTSYGPAAYALPIRHDGDCHFAVRCITAPLTLCRYGMTVTATSLYRCMPVPLMFADTA